jgi:hypothetical protein
MVFFRRGDAGGLLIDVCPDWAAARIDAGAMKPPAAVGVRPMPGSSRDSGGRAVDGILANDTDLIVVNAAGDVLLYAG